MTVVFFKVRVVVVRITGDSRAFLRRVLNQVFVETSVLICIRCHRGDRLLRNADEDFSIFEIASFLALKTQPVSDAACLRV